MRRRNVMRDQVLHLHGQLRLIPLSLRLIVKVEGLPAQSRGLSIELMACDVSFLFLIRRLAETLRHVAGLAGLPFLRGFTPFPVPYGFRFWNGDGRDCMAGEAEIRLLVELQELRIVRLALQRILVAAEDRSTGLEFDRGVALDVGFYALNQMALNAADTLESRVAGDDLFYHRVGQIGKHHC